MDQGSVDSKWEKEPIPNSDSLFMRAHKDHCRTGELDFGVFRDRGRGMSTDWSKYSTPEETRNRGRIPELNAILSLPVGGVREIDLVVEHDPLNVERAKEIGIDPNRAHTEVIGEKTTEIRLKLRRICEEVLPLPELK